MSLTKNNTIKSFLIYGNNSPEYKYLKMMDTGSSKNLSDGSESMFSLCTKSVTISCINNTQHFTNNTGITLGQKFKTSLESDADTEDENMYSGTNNDSKEVIS